MRILLLFLLLTLTVPAQEKIQWYATWEMGLRQARATGRPILLIAAAPHCHNVSGIW
ncbi:MAG: hypothetical protein KF760_01165 [Candidatus Eremiobacteraeota bacterium]|nr:hypothetical protein [Candidatus Eremiobacteraeota bacterium]MCW5868065.1 hypothetical protein [Candidatus Eremiobacteraeota bacterium]